MISLVRHVEGVSTTYNKIFMKIFRVVGLGLFILMLQFFVPRVFFAIEDTLVLFLDTTQQGLEVTANALEPVPAPELPR